MIRPTRDVVRDARRGDQGALAELVRAHQQRLFGLVLMMVREPAAAEEVTQDALVRACTHLDRYDERRPFYPWLATIAVRLAQNWLRQRGRGVQRQGASLEDVQEPGVPAAALTALIDDEQSRELWGAVAALPSGERTCVFLFYRDEMAVGDIARTLGVTPGTVKTWLFRARRHLREHLASYSNPAEHGLV